MQYGQESSSSLKPKIQHWRSNARSLGSGSFCDVFLVNVFDGEQSKEVAVKVRKAAAVMKPGEQFNNLKDEARVLKEIEHENVVKLINVEMNEKEEIAVLYLEYLPYCLRDLMTDSMRFNLQEAFSEFRSPHGFVDMFLSLINVLQYLHEKDILYPDLHSYNVRLNQHGVLVLTDFGCLFKVSELSKWPHAARSYYLAPEIRAGEPVTLSGQVYGVGLLVIQILESKCIEIHEDSQALIEVCRAQNKRALLRSLITRWKETVVTEYAKMLDVMGYQCCQTNPDDRPGFDQLNDCLINIQDVFETECPDSDDSECSDDESPPCQEAKAR